MGRGLLLACALCASTAALTSCTSTSSSAPASSAISSAPVSSPTSSSAVTSTSAPPSTPSRATSSSAPPLSAYEADPGVRGLRAWAAEVGRTVNTGHYNSSALMRLMSQTVSTMMKAIVGREVGHHFNGPLPFTPIRVVATSPSQRDIRICYVDAGFSVNPKTGRPYTTQQVAPGDATMALRGGRWIVSTIYSGSFSCRGVKVPTPSW